MNNLISDSLLWEDFNENFNLDKSHIHIFKISLDSYQVIKKSYEFILTADELSKAARFTQEPDRIRYIIGKFYSKMLLAKILNENPADIGFEFNQYKKPYVNNIHFNISHSGDFVVIAISKNAIGIDIELINPNFNYEELIYQCFGDDEIKVIKDMDSFYLFWTRKEALLKATGEGLTDNLPAINCTTRFEERFGIQYELRSFKLDEGYFLSTASSEHNSVYKNWHLK
ncbi:4'-phosphopantetheinyl transferase superfamily protein [Pedobacter sp. Leaf176]|uniref:4'-phosphopantetheinyl transferase family protein n=1 Tax=Pedobacter sp. Leaf176 TaxID=1736286 RepID=UPI0006FBED7B|nr:4'-phosphopantetheinyl transferase superfamily protein [Pedobacter sp. Leaf176]KQR67625.1 hypothetical protein ASF92_18275 [Pedobacter sp. Leaf176]